MAIQAGDTNDNANLFSPRKHLHRAQNSEFCRLRPPCYIQCWTNSDVRVQIGSRRCDGHFISSSLTTLRITLTTTSPMSPPSPARKPLPPFFSLIYANSCKSAVPTVYYAIFAIHEPFLCVAGMIGTFVDPVKVCIPLLSPTDQPLPLQFCSY